MVSPVDTPFQLAPKPLNGVGVNFSFDVFLAEMIHPLVRVAQFSKRIVRIQFIRHHSRTGSNILLNKRNDVRYFVAPDNMGDDVSLSLNHPKNRCFPCGTPTSLTWFPSSNIGLIYLNSLRQFLFRFGEQASNLLCNSPSSFVSNACLPLQFLSGHPILGVSKKEDGIEPAFKRRFRLMKDGASQRMKLIPAILTGIALSTSYLMKLGGFLAGRTNLNGAISVVEYLG